MFDHWFIDPIVNHPIFVQFANANVFTSLARGKWFAFVTTCWWTQAASPTTVNQQGHGWTTSGWWHVPSQVWSKSRYKERLIGHLEHHFTMWFLKPVDPKVMDGLFPLIGHSTIWFHHSSSWPRSPSKPAASWSSLKLWWMAPGSQVCSCNTSAIIACHW